MIRKEQQPEPQEGDSAMGATANSCEGGRTSSPERDRGELRGGNQAPLCRELAVGQLSELRDSLELSQQGPIPRDLTCLIRLFKRVFTLWLFWVLVVTYGLQSTQSKYAALVASMRGGISVLDQESNRVPCTGRRILNPWTTGKSLIQRLGFIDFCQGTRVVWPTQWLHAQIWELVRIIWRT